MSGDVCCWWCCHPFPGPSLHYPYKYDAKTKKFTTTGHFCSWECVKAYAIDQNIPRSGEFQAYIALMHKHANNNKYTITNKAPKRYALKMFGGSLTIEEFRHGSSNVCVTMPYEHHVMPHITAAGPTRVAPPPAASGQTSDLVLRRQKPLARTRSSLETSLGIIRKTR
jgi:MYM-type Zinc finger with FCS sequence motif